MSEKSIDYQKDLTFEQVWASIQKLGDKIERLTEKYDAIFEREHQEREEREAKERQEREKREDREAKERQANDERMRKLQETIDQTSRDLNKNMGALSNTFGTLVEHLVAPNIAEKFNNLGYHFNKIWQRGLEIHENGQIVTEVDIVLENDETIALVEIKSKPNMRDIKEHLERMQIVRRDFERSKNTKELIGAVAGAVFPDFVKQFAIETGFYVITQTGDTVKIDVPENFKPRIF